MLGDGLVAKKIFDAARAEAFVQPSENASRER